MCCVSLFCMGYTRPHTGQGKELSFGVWEGIMRGQREKEGKQGALTSCPTHHLQQSTPFPGQGPTLTGSGLFFLGKKKALKHSFPWATRSQAWSPLLITHALSSEHMENQLASSGENAKAPRVTALCWLTWDMGLLSIHRTRHYRLFSYTILQARTSSTGNSPGEQASTW